MEQVIYRQLTDGFDADELSALAYELTGTKDALFTDSDTVGERAIAVTTWAARRGKLPALIDLIAKKRG